MEASQTFNIQTVSPLEALWALFASQPRAIRKAFTERVLQEDVHAETLRQQLMVKESLTQAFEELKEAERTGRKLPDAHNLFK